MFEPWVQTLSPLKFTSRFNSSSKSSDLEFNLKFEPGVRRELRCSNPGFEAPNSKFGVLEPWFGTLTSEPGFEHPKNLCSESVEVESPTK